MDDGLLRVAMNYGGEMRKRRLGRAKCVRSEKRVQLVVLFVGTLARFSTLLPAQKVLS